jgi:hypothetical protein
MTPRLLSREQLLKLLNISSSTFARWRAAGLLPDPLPGTKRWDRLAIERALDRAGSAAERRAPTLAERAGQWVR